MENKVEEEEEERAGFSVFNRHFICRQEKVDETDKKKHQEEITLIQKSDTQKRKRIESVGLNQSMKTVRCAWMKRAT